MADRKSGSAGMPRPLSYAVFCLKKTKYKTQKKEALRKLESTETNLLRIGDIIKEVKRHFFLLQRQARKSPLFPYTTLFRPSIVIGSKHIPLNATGGGFLPASKQFRHG